MKNYITKGLRALIAVLFAAFIACEGPEGPQGPKGDQGAIGQQGLQGPAGPAGINNFIASPWIGNIQWSKREIPPLHSYFYFHDDPRLNLEIMNQGLVMVYWRQQPNWTPLGLPTMIYWADQTGKPAEFAYLIEFRMLPFQLEIFHAIPPKFSELGGIAQHYPNSQFRYFIIPGNPAGRMNLPDWEDYQAVCDYFGVEP